MSAVDRTEVALELLDHAEGDLRAAEKLAPDDDQADHVIGLQAQQAVEKALKAVLVYRGAEMPRTHDIAYLVDQLRAASAPAPASLIEARWLSAWAGARRYETSEPLDRPAALNAARAAVDWARDRLRDLV